MDLGPTHSPHRYQEERPIHQQRHRRRHGRALAISAKASSGVNCDDGGIVRSGIARGRRRRRNACVGVVHISKFLMLHELAELFHSGPFALLSALFNH